VNEGHVPRYDLALDPMHQQAQRRVSDTEALGRPDEVVAGPLRKGNTWSCSLIGSAAADERKCRYGSPVPSRFLIGIRER
jgi:hypothetical protein